MCAHIDTSVWWMPWCLQSWTACGELTISAKTIKSIINYRTTFFFLFRSLCSTRLPLSLSCLTRNYQEVQISNAITFFSLLCIILHFSNILCRAVKWHVLIIISCTRKQSWVLRVIQKTVRIEFYQRPNFVCIFPNSCNFSNSFLFFFWYTFECVIVSVFSLDFI